MAPSCVTERRPIRPGSARSSRSEGRSRYGKVDAMPPAVHNDNVVEHTEPACNNAPDRRNIERAHRFAICLITAACSMTLVAVFFPDEWFVPDDLSSSFQNVLHATHPLPPHVPLLPPRSPPFTPPGAPSPSPRPPSSPSPSSPQPWQPPLLPPVSPPPPEQAYLEAVYGPGVSGVDVESLQVVYGANYLPSEPAQSYVRSLFSNGAPCFALGGEGDVACSKIQSGDQTRRINHPPWASNEGILLYNPMYRARRIKYDDYSWAEVTRWSAACRRDSWQCEGRTIMRQNYWREGDPWAETPQAYGCWFFVAPGSGVFVNTGRTLFFENRRDASHFFGVASDKAERHRNQAADDTGWCSEALRRGIDSIQVNVHSYILPDSGQDRDLIELVVCNGRCATEELCGICPPLELRTGPAANSSCDTCDERGGMLNCGRLVPSTCDGSNPRPLKPLDQQ